MTDELEKKVRQSVSLIQEAVGDKVAPANARRRKCTNKGTTMP